MIPIKEKAWGKLPKGWSKNSAKKFWKKAGGKVDTCIEMMTGKVDNPATFCASLKDYLLDSPYWRGEEGEKKLKPKIKALKKGE